MLMKLTTGVPLSKHYMSRIFAVCKERIWRIFQTQTEFLNLTFQLQLQLVNTNSLMVFCLMLAKWESYKTGANFKIDYKNLLYSNALNILS